MKVVALRSVRHRRGRRTDEGRARRRSTSSTRAPTSSPCTRRSRPRPAAWSSRAAFAKMKKGVRIVNCARGGIVDERGARGRDQVGPRRRRRARRLRRGAAAEGPPAAGAAAGDRDAAPRRLDQRGADQRRDRDRRADHRVPAARRGRGGGEHAVGEPRDAGDPAARTSSSARSSGASSRSSRAEPASALRGRVRRPDRRARRAPGDERDPARLAEPVPRGQRQLRERAGDRARARPRRHASRRASRRATSSTRSPRASRAPRARARSRAPSSGRNVVRLVRINDFYMEAVPEGYVLMLNNHDVPGVVGRVGTLLGARGINIAGLELGRERVGGMAISFFHVDEAVPESVLEELRRSPDIVSAAAASTSSRAGGHVAARSSSASSGGTRARARSSTSSRGRGHRRPLRRRQQRRPHPRRRRRAHRPAPDPVRRAESEDHLRDRATAS